MSDMQNEKADAQWFLRTGGESVFGPVSTQGLIVWAEQGRILPGHEVSNDRKKWVQAVSLDMLDMRWFVDDGEGELRGPLNRLAAEALIKSGKVPEGAHLVSSEDIETPADEEKAAEAPSEKASGSHDHVPEAVLRVRVRELESMVTGQRDRLAKLANADAIETVQQERDVLASLVKEVEAQRDAVLRNAEKDARTFERKMEQLRQQIRKLEQQLEETNNRLVLSDEAVAAAGTEQRTAEAQDQLIEQVRREAAETVERLTQEAGAVREKLVGVERQLEEACQAGAASQAAFELERVSLNARVSALEKAVGFHEKRDAETQQILTTREAELAEAHARVEAAERSREAAEAAVQAAEQKTRDAEAAFAELLNDANVRDSGYAEKVAALEKACALSPEETSRFYADQAAVYELVKTEVDELAKTMELERAHSERLKELSVQRQQSLIERRQTLLKQLGGSPVDMTRLAVRQQPADPNAARLRAELDELRTVHLRDVRTAEERERNLQLKLRVLESETTKLQGQAVEGDKLGRRLQELTELLRKREQELSDERKNREAEREQFQGSQQALLMRIESLEKSSRPSTPDEIQSAEARNVKIATWMRLKK